MLGLFRRIAEIKNKHLLLVNHGFYKTLSGGYCDNHLRVVTLETFKRLSYTDLKRSL